MANITLQRLSRHEYSVIVEGKKPRNFDIPESAFTLVEQEGISGDVVDAAIMTMTALEDNIAIFSRDTGKLVKTGRA